MINFLFLARKLKNELVRNYRNCNNRETGNWSGYLSESSQTHSEKSRLDFLSLPGKTNLKAKTTLFATSKKSPDTKRPNSHKRRGRWRLKEFLGFMLNLCIELEGISSAGV